MKLNLYIFAFVTISVIGLLHESSRTTMAEETTSRKPCWIVDYSIRLGGTVENFDGIGDGPFTICSPVLAKISHTGHERYVDSCGQNYWEVNFSYEMEHEGELWFTKDLSKAWVNIHESSGQQLSMKIHKANGFYFAAANPEICKHYKRYSFSNARQGKDVDLELFTPHNSLGQRLVYVPPSFIEKTGILSRASSTLFNIGLPNEAQIDISLPIAEFLELRNGQALVREITWGGGGPDSVHYWTNKLNFELQSISQPGILLVTPTDGLLARGPDKDGKYKPTQKTYTLKNVGKSPIDFSVIKSKNWCSATPTEGTLFPSTETQVTVSLNEKTNKLKQSENDTVRFDNRTNQEGSTTRSVSVVQTERWRVTFIGWDIITTGSEPLIAGIKAYWTMAVDIEIEAGMYKSGWGKVSFGNTYGTLKPYSLIPNGYACETLKKKIDVTTFNVPGSVAGSMVNLRLPLNNFLRITFRCQLNEKHTMDWLKKTKYGGQTPEDRIRGAYKERRDSDIASLPHGTFTVPLVDGHRETLNSPNAINASPYEIIVKRLK